MMRIDYILLKNFKCMPFYSSSTFEHTFTSKMSLIKGINGAGKSSFLNELTPLPSDKSLFYKDGYKEIHITHNNNQYKLVSDFRSGQSFSFICNDEELNQSGNVTTQKELVYRHFGINSTIHEILIGRDTISNMSLVNRKKLFNSITHLNIDKLLDVYNDFKEEHKNLLLLIKTNTSLLLAEENKLIDSNHLNNLLEQQKSIREYIDFFLSFREELIRNEESGSLDSLYSNFKALYDKIDSALTRYYIYVTGYSKNDIHAFKAKMDVVNFKLNELYKTLEKKQQEITILQLNKENDLNSLVSKSEEIKKHIETLTSSLSILKDINVDLTAIKNDIYKLEVSLVSVLREIPINENRKYSKESYEKLLQEKNELLEKLNKLILREIEVSKELEHLKLHTKELVCPSCEYKWIPSEVENSIQNLDIELKELLKNKLTIQSRLKENEKELIEMNEYFTLYKQYASLRNATLSTLKSFWTIVDREEYIFKNPTEIINLLKTLNMDVIHIENILNLNNQYKDITNSIDVMKSIKSESIESISREIEEIEESIFQLNLDKNKYNQYIANAELSTRVVNSLNSFLNALESARSDLQKGNVGYTVSVIINDVESELDKLRIQLIGIEKEIMNYNNIKYTIDKYRAQIDELNKKLNVVGYILEEMSPKSGFIARSIGSFLNVIISNMNKVIESIWEYDMKLEPIKIDEEVLNYKFKVNVEDKLIINDINTISSGMKEIVNLSFKLVIYKLLGLDGYPIYLDELAANLDSTHSDKMLQFVNMVCTSGNYSQVFAITHKENYGYIKDMECIELS